MNTKHIPPTGRRTPETEIQRQIGFHQTMITRTQEKAEKKKSEYAAKIQRLEQELQALKKTNKENNNE